ncbi:MAG: hypothetical protein CMJ31_08430 [Phycisphaerae bacterium]|nr:hypothetical protein [Phycisphaerae bacterium]
MRLFARSVLTALPPACVFAAAGLAVTGSAVVAEPLQPTYLQLFENEWEDIERRAPDIFMAGYNVLWVPPPSIASDPYSVGFDVFDRFDLGKPPHFDNSSSRRRTAYGTEETFRSMIAAMHRAGIQIHIDTVLNHNSGRSTSDAFFADGGWPGFHVPRSPDGNGGFRDKQPGDDWGDFHGGANGAYLQSENPGGFNYDTLRGDLVALCDIDQTTNLQFIRQPVEAGNPDNIPAGNIRDLPDPANVRFYQDRDQAGFTVVNPLGPDFDGNGQPDPMTFYPYTQASPDEEARGESGVGVGDPVTENGTGYLMRWLRWMLEVQGVDGFRLDAAKHVYPFFWDQFYDSAVYMGRILPDGSRATPFSFGENTTGAQDILNNYFRKDAFADRDSLDLSGAGDLRNIVGAGGFGSWQNVFNSMLDTADDGLQNGTAGVNHVFSHDNGSVGDGGSRPPLPTERQQGLVANAFVMMHPGPGIVYHNARGVTRNFGFFPREGNPTALGFDPATQTPDDDLTKLVRIRNQYGNAQIVASNPTEQTFTQLNSGNSDILVVERGQGGTADLLVGLNDRYDEGFNLVFTTTNFPEGTRLIELTGNANDPAIDPTDEIPERITVGANGFVLLRVPRNASSEGEHHKGYVIYGPPVPGGSLSIIDPDDVIPPDPNFRPDFVQRVNDIPVITRDAFDIRVETFAQDTFDNTSDDNALFKIDDGYGDFNGNGGPDFPPTQTIVGGFEQFTDLSVPGMTQPDRQGEYQQTIDATTLVEGFHYIEAIAFRPRAAGATPLFADFREVVCIDREPIEFDLAQAGMVVEDDQPDFAITVEDGTAEFVHAFLNLPAGADPVAEIGLGTEARKYDAREYRKTLDPLDEGTNRVTVVVLETSGRAVARDFEVFFGDVNPCPADLGAPMGVLDIADVVAFLQLFGQADPAADLGAPAGVFDVADVVAFLQAFGAGCP